MNNLSPESFGNESMPSELKNPFAPDKIKSIYVRYAYSGFSHNWQAYGSIEFENGDTTGEQKFEGETFDGVVQKMKIFIENFKENHYD